MENETKGKDGMIEVVTVERKVPVDLFDTIGFNDTVTILTPHGQNLSGKARIRNREYDSWVCAINGGKYGQPMIATRDNVIKVKKGRKSA